MQTVHDRLTELRRNDGGMTRKVRAETPRLPRAFNVRTQHRLRVALWHERRDQFGSCPAIELHHVPDEEPIAVIMAGAGGIEIGVSCPQALNKAFDIGIGAESDVIGEPFIDPVRKVELPRWRQLLLDQ